MCRKCRNKMVCFSDFHKQSQQYIKEKVDKKDRTYICSGCGEKYRVTKTKILTEFAVRFFAVVGILEVLSMLEMIDSSMLLGMEQDFFVDKLIEIGLFMIMCMVFYPLILRLNSFVHWIFSRPIKWYTDEASKFDN